jgi:tetratricopeptide (TPR) repeat protein
MNLLSLSSGSTFCPSKPPRTSGSPIATREIVLILDCSASMAPVPARHANRLTAAVLYLRARLLQRLGRFAESLAVFEEALRLDRLVADSFVIARHCPGVAVVNPPVPPRQGSVSLLRSGQSKTLRLFNALDFRLLRGVVKDLWLRHGSSFGLTQTRRGKSWFASPPLSQRLPRERGYSNVY